MFTGLIEEIGLVKSIGATPGGAGLQVEAKTILDGLKLGDSIAVSGPCLTVAAAGKNSFTAWAMPETLKKTTLGALGAGSRVNLERALALGDRLGGHMVSGHIDTTVTMKGRRPEGKALLLSFTCPPALLRYIVDKGSVALDGVSLTVVSTGPDGFTVGVIPHTAGETTIGEKRIGDRVNLEVDLIGKYVEKMVSPHAASRGKEPAGITFSYLQEKGYT